jgi:hypothetical protein
VLTACPAWVHAGVLYVIAQSRMLRSLQTHLTSSGHAEPTPRTCAEQLDDMQLLQASFVGWPEAWTFLPMHEAKSPVVGAGSAAAGVVAAGGGAVAATGGSAGGGVAVAAGGVVVATAVAFVGVVVAGGSDPQALAQTATKTKTEAPFFMEPLLPHFLEAVIGSPRRGSCKTRPSDAR